MLLRTFKRSMLQPLTPDPLYLRLALSCMSQGATMSLKWWRVDHESKGLRVQAPSVQHCPQPSWLINQQFAWDSLFIVPKSNQLHTSCCCCREGLLIIFDMVTNNEKPASKWIAIKITNTNKERRDAPTKVQKGEEKAVHLIVMEHKSFFQWHHCRDRSRESLWFADPTCHCPHCLKPQGLLRTLLRPISSTGEPADGQQDPWGYRWRY